MSKLSLREVSVAPKQGGERLFAPVSFELDEGDSLLISGPSGSGKSTLLRAISYLIPALEGEICLDGKRPTPQEIPAYRRQVCYVPQVPSAHEETVGTVLRRPFRYASAGQSVYPEERAAEMFGRLGISQQDSEKNFADLSVGERQRVCLVRALIVEPKFLLLDEPSSALDAGNAKSLYELWEGLPKRPGVVLVTHDGTLRDLFSSATVLELAS